jgi:predicted alpha-1,6-mannanase (GH76 family)
VKHTVLFPLFPFKRQGNLLLRQIQKGCLASLAFFLLSPSRAATAREADVSLDAFNAAFLVQKRGDAYYKHKLNSENDPKFKDYFWRQALEIQMMEDVYLRSQNPEHKRLINALLKTFIQQNGETWFWNDFQDDLAWAVLAFARGYQITGNPAYRKLAKIHFDFAYERGHDAVFGGGLWWDVKKEGKFGLSNNPIVIAACYLYEITEDKEYVEKAKATYAWHREKLYNSDTGACYEKILADGTLIKDATVYNMGAFVEAASRLYRITKEPLYFEDAKRTVDFVRNRRTEKGILSSGHRDGTWASEFARGLGVFVRDNNLGEEYGPWIRQNAEAAWNCRRLDKNLSWNKWSQQTPEEPDQMALECVSTVVMLQIAAEHLPSDSSTPAPETSPLPP